MYTAAVVAFVAIPGTWYKIRALQYDTTTTPFSLSIYLVQHYAQASGNLYSVHAGSKRGERNYLLPIQAAVP